MQAYSDPSRENEPTALPDLEVFYMSADEIAYWFGDGEHSDLEGWHWWFCFPGCLPDSEPFGPFDSEAEALADARECNGY